MHLQESWASILAYEALKRKESTIEHQFGQELILVSFGWSGLLPEEQQKSVPGFTAGQAGKCRRP